MVRILLADDHSAIRNGLKNILSREFSPIEFGDASNSAIAFNQVTNSKWDLLILDVKLPGRGGLEVLKSMKEAGLEVPVLAFSFHQEDQIAARAFQSGASAYLPKSASDTEFIATVRTLLDGKKDISLTASSNGQNPHELLSVDEYRTLLLLGSGKSPSQISERLLVSVSTINTHRTKILEKMKLKSNADIIYYVVENKLISLE